MGWGAALGLFFQAAIVSNQCVLESSEAHSSRKSVVCPWHFGVQSVMVRSCWHWEPKDKSHSQPSAWLQTAPDSVPRSWGQPPSCSLVMIIPRGQTKLILPETLSLNFLTGGSKGCHTLPMAFSVPCPGSVLTAGLARHSWERGIMAVLRGTSLPPDYEQAKIRGSTVCYKLCVHGTALNPSYPLHRWGEP